MRLVATVGEVGLASVGIIMSEGCGRGGHIVGDGDLGEAL